MKLLGGTKKRMIIEEKEERREKEEGIEKNGEETEKITREELMKQLKRLKKEKVPGENGIENEVWRLMPKEIGEVFLKLLNKIWRKEEFQKNGIED